jgi:hypothetical protein
MAGGASSCSWLFTKFSVCYPRESWTHGHVCGIRTTTVVVGLSGPQMISGVIYKEKHSHPHLHIFS